MSTANVLSPPKTFVGVFVCGMLLRQSDTGVEVLLQKRPSAKFPEGRWCFPGGMAEGKEDVEDALVRIFQKSIGIKVSSGKPIHTMIKDVKDGRAAIIFETVRSSVGEPKAVDPGTSIQWFQLKDHRKVEWMNDLHSEAAFMLELRR